MKQCLLTAEFTKCQAKRWCPEVYQQFGIIGVPPEEYLTRWEVYCRARDGGKRGKVISIRKKEG